MNVKTTSKLGIVFFCMVLLVGLLAGCGGNSSSNNGNNAPAASNGNKTDKKLKIGVTVYYMSEFITLAVEGIKKEVADQGAELVLLDASNDVSKQISQVENLISQNVDAIVIAAVDSDSLNGSVAQAKEKGIPVIALNMLINSPDITAYAGPNDVQAGELETQYVMDKIGGKGNVLILEGPIGVSAQQQRKEGIHNVLAQNPDVNVLAEKTANWSREEALKLTENWLQAFSGKIDAIIAHNDEMALGAIEALEAKGLKSSIPVVGIDAIKDACLSIEKGLLDATVFQDADKEARLAIKLAVQAARGEAVEKTNMIEMELVTKDNVNKYLEIYK